MLLLRNVHFEKIFSLSKYEFKIIISNFLCISILFSFKNPSVNLTAVLFSSFIFSQPIQRKIKREKKTKNIQIATQYTNESGERKFPSLTILHSQRQNQIGRQLANTSCECLVNEERRKNRKELRKFSNIIKFTQESQTELCLHEVFNRVKGVK